MLKRLIVLVLILPLLALSGCAYSVAVPDILGEETHGSLVFTPTSERLDSIVVAPAYFEFGTVSHGSTIDTWTEDGYLQVGRNKVNHQRGDPLYFVIFNDSFRAYTFEISYEDTVDDITWCDATQQEYHKAPSGVEQAVVISDSSVDLQSGEAITIPFSITLPENTEYPVLWEFRLSILRKSPGSMQEVGGKIRVFVSMK